MNIEDSCISCIDTDWSYQLARRMEKEKTNPVLGYRTAGSAAETATGDMLYREMKAIGLTDVTRDTFSLDGWEFEKAVLKFTDDSGQEHTFQMGGYQTNFETDGFEDYELVYLGKGTAADYEGINVKGKLVMVEINQRDEWWISFPVYQAYLRGAAALIAVQANGYGEIAESALNAQDIAGPDFAPAFSLSQADARILKRSLRNKISAREDNTTDSEDTHNTPEQDAALLLLKVSHKDLKIILILMSVCIDLTSFHRKLDAGNFLHPFTESSCHSTTSGTNLQNLLFPCKGKPAQNILPDMRKMIKNWPALSLTDHSVKFFRCKISGNCKHFILYRTITV